MSCGGSSQRETLARTAIRADGTTESDLEAQGLPAVLCFNKSVAEVHVQALLSSPQQKNNTKVGEGHASHPRLCAFVQEARKFRDVGG